MANRLFLSIATLFIVACSAACGAEDASGPNEPFATDEDDVTGARSLAFSCTATENDLMVRISANKKNLSVILGLENQVTGKGTLDPTYRPRPNNKSYVRYGGFPTLAYDSTDVNFLVENAMFEGRQGHVKFQQRGEDFEQIVYTCKVAGRP